MVTTYDLAIIGAGSAGLTAASVARDLGAQVALIEKDRPGGDCTFSGCVPSKALIKIASVAHAIRHASQFGLQAEAPPVDLAQVMNKVRETIDEVYAHERPQVLRDQGIDVFLGPAKLRRQGPIQVGDQDVHARRILLCTGAHPFAPPIEGLADTPYLDHVRLWGLTTLPESLIVVGGGPIGCEMAQAFGRLGSKVTLVHSGPRLLPHDEPEASRVIAEVFAEEGIDVLLNAPARRVTHADQFEVTAGDRALQADGLLVAAGRRPNVRGLGLADAGVAFSDRGIQVDAALRTSAPHVWAAGDCTGGPQFSHHAGMQGAIAVRNALFPGNSRGAPPRVPWTTFTDPEVAQAGMLLQDALREHPDAQVSRLPLHEVDRARTDRSKRGFVQVVHRGGGEVLGATCVAGRAAEMLQEWIIAMDHGLKIGDLVESTHVYPSYATANQQLAARVRMREVSTGWTGRLLRTLRR